MKCDPKKKTIGLADGFKPTEANVNPVSLPQQRQATPYMQCVLHLDRGMRPLDCRLSSPKSRNMAIMGLETFHLAKLLIDLK